MRKLISAGFTPRMIARLDEHVAQRTTEVLDAAAAKNDINFVRDVAYALPMHMIATSSASPKPTAPTCSTGPTSSCAPPIPTARITPAALATPAAHSSATPHSSARRSAATPSTTSGASSRRSTIEDDDGDA